MPISTIIIITIILVVIVVLTIVFTERALKKDMSECTEEVYAIVDKFVTKYTDMGGTDPGRVGEFPLYKYTYNNQEYNVRGNPSLARIKVGDRVKLYINPNNPEQFHAENEKHLALKWIITFLVTIFVLVGLGILLSNMI